MKALPPIFIAISLAFWVLTGVAHGQGIVPHFSVTPEKFDLTVERGDLVEKSIRILNRSEVAFPFEVRVSNFTAEEGTGTIQFYAGAEPRGTDTRNHAEEGVDDTSFNPRKWITVENPNFILDPGEDEEVIFSIEVPEDAEPGGHYAVVLFEPRLPSFYFEGESPRVIPQIGVLLLFTVEVEGAERSAEPLVVSTFNLSREERMKVLERAIRGVLPQARAREDALQIIDRSSFNFILGVKNNDIVHIRPEGTITLHNFYGKKVDEFEIHPLTVLPGKVREYHIEFDPAERKSVKFIPDFLSRNLYLGSYSANVQLQSPEGFSVSEIFTFWIFPWKFLLSSLLIFGIIGIGFLKIRKRLFASVQVLVSGRGRDGL